jgi:hypothetical protein
VRRAPIFVFLGWRPWHSTFLLFFAYLDLSQSQCEALYTVIVVVTVTKFGLRRRIARFFRGWGQFGPHLLGFIAICHILVGIAIHFC